jgi:hypothetical protein
MLAYLAAEDPETITRERASADQITPRGGPGGGQGGAFAWPTCQQAPRKTSPRIR